jgi:hypothetical protein
MSLETIWDWLVHTDAGTATRIGAGAAALAALAISELARKGRQARRWREYLFLLAATAVAMVYGVVNDQITITISWEYFFYGKGFYLEYGVDGNPGEAALRLKALALGMKATWWTGLIFGAVALVANSYPRRLAALPLRALYRLLPVPLATAAGLGAILGIGGYFGLFARLGEFRAMVESDLWRPARFMGVWGIHLGGYVGGGVGAIIVAWRILRRRKGNKPCAAK